MNYSLPKRNNENNFEQIHYMVERIYFDKR